MTGALKIGNPSSTVMPSVGLTIHDARSGTHTPGVMGKAANFFFTNQPTPISG